MTVTKCDWCGKTFISGDAVMVRLVSHSRFPEANVSINKDFPVLKSQYDVCGECMCKLLEARVDEKHSSV